MPRFNNYRRRSGRALVEIAQTPESFVPDVESPEATLEVETMDAAPSVARLADEPEDVPRKRVLLAGAGGAIGFPLLRFAHEAGYWVRTLSKSRWRAAKISLLTDDLWLRDAMDRDAIRGICRGVDVVVSCLGGSLDPRAEERRGYAHLDFEANRHLLDEAIEAKVSRFVYVSVFCEKHSENTAYVRAHRRFEQALRESGLNYTILRFAGLHTHLDSLFAMARGGSMPLLGKADSRSNPIHPEDAARLCLQHLETGPEVVDAGGPEIFTRRELSEMVFDTVGGSPRYYQVPSLWLRLASFFTHPFNPRRANLLDFLIGASRTDVIAPRVGTRPVLDYFLEYQGNTAFLNEPV